MKNWTLVIAALAAMMMAIAQAQATDYSDEIREWVIDPCMQVGAALDAKAMDQESRDLGIKRSHIAQMMIASREGSIQELAGKMKSASTWKARRAVYPLMLKLCLSNLPAMK